jgi:acetyltransferase-like isoleucine patch superfamily enzyme
MIAALWKSRDRFPMGSGEWCRAWIKRFLQSPRLITQALAHGRLRRAGASVAPSAFLAQASLMSGRLELLHIGPESFIGRVEVSVHAPVTIGNRVCINDGAKILSASHDIRQPHWPSIARTITIGDYAWIATNAIILPGVTIGRGAVVGAGAVVTRDVPEGAVATGNPARLQPGQRSPQLAYAPTANLALFTAWRRLQQGSLDSSDS